jgi:hypothetical protein
MGLYEQLMVADAHRKDLAILIGQVISRLSHLFTRKEKCRVASQASDQSVRDGGARRHDGDVGSRIQLAHVEEYGQGAEQ